MTGGMVGARASSMIQDGEDRIGSRNGARVCRKGVVGTQRCRESLVIVGKKSPRYECPRDTTLRAPRWGSRDEERERFR